MKWNGKWLLAASLLAALLLAATATRGQNEVREDAELDELRSRVSRFLDRISYGEVQNAYDDLLAGSPLAMQTTNVRQLVEQTGELEKQFGPLANFESVASRRVGRDVVLLDYLYKCQQLPVVWHFAYYRPSASQPWRLIAVRFDTDLEALALGQ